MVFTVMFAFIPVLHQSPAVPDAPPPSSSTLRWTHENTDELPPFYLLTLQRESMQNLICLLYHQRGSWICPCSIRAKASHGGEGGRWVEVRWGWQVAPPYSQTQRQERPPLWFLQPHEADTTLQGRRNKISQSFHIKCKSLPGRQETFFFLFFFFRYFTFSLCFQWVPPVPNAGN